MVDDSKRSLLFGDDYHTFFDAELYLRFCYEHSPEEVEHLRDLADSLHDIFKDGNIRGKRLLDIGTGPAILSVISASQWFDDITLSDYTEQCRTSLKKWVNNDPSVYNFKPLFEYICKLQNKSDWRLIEQKLKSSVTEIVPCDVTQADIIPRGANASPFDVITSSLCIEAAVKTQATYIQVLKKLAAMLNDGGHLVLIGVLEQTHNSVGETFFHTISLSKNFIHSALEEAGFSDIRWYVKGVKTEGYSVADPNGIFILNAKKK